MIKLGNVRQYLSLKVFPFWSSGLNRLLKNRSLFTGELVNSHVCLLRLRDLIFNLVVIGYLGSMLTPNKRLFRGLNYLFRFFVFLQEVTLRFKYLFEIFAGELNNVLGTVSDNLLRVILKNLWEVSVHLNLIWRENAHLSSICHTSCLS